MPRPTDRTVRTQRRVSRIPATGAVHRPPWRRRGAAQIKPVDRSLGAAHSPFVIEADPSRLDDRKHILAAVDAAHRAHDNGVGVPGEERLFSARAKAAFDLSQERPELKDRYGRHGFGKSWNCRVRNSLR